MRVKRLSCSCARQRIAILLFFGMLHGLALGQDGFVAIPPAQASSYRLDFAKNFFITPEAEKADRDYVYATLKDLESLKGRLAEVDTLLEQIAQKADLYKRYQRLRADYSKRMASANLPPRFTISQASEIVRNSLAPLGADYGRN